MAVERDPFDVELENLRTENKRLQAQNDALITALDMAQATLRNDMMTTRVRNALSVMDEALAEVEIPEPISD